MILSLNNIQETLKYYSPLVMFSVMKLAENPLYTMLSSVINWTVSVLENEVMVPGDVVPQYLA